MNSALYFREKGPVCYEATLFQDDEELSSLIQGLLASGLNWYWTSVRPYDAIDEFRHWNLPEKRYFALLTTENSDQLRQDFQEECEDDCRRSIDLFGVNSEKSIGTEVDLERSIKEFLSGDDSTLECCICQIIDERRQYSFIPQVPSDNLQRLLDKWQLNKESAKKIRKYKHLYLAQLESMADGIVTMAFQKT